MLNKPLPPRPQRSHFCRLPSLRRGPSRSRTSSSSTGPSPTVPDGGASPTFLVKDGYTVSVVQEPLTSLADDVAATKRVLDLQQGPTLLVGHSYGGVVITEAGNAPNVVGLVYIAAFIPDQGESAVSLLSKFPAANNDMRATKDDFLYLDPAAFPADFAADVPKARGEIHGPFPA